MNKEAENRRRKLEKRLREIEYAFLGLDTPVSRFVCDETGLPTDRKVQDLADKIVSDQCYLYGKHIGIEGVRKRYFELLFYLILRAYDPDGKICHFADFIDVAKELGKAYKSREELILRDAGMFGGHKNYYAAIRRSCKILTKHSLSDDLTKEELNKLKRTYEEKRSECKRISEIGTEYKAAVLKKYEDYGIEGYTDYYDALNNKYWYQYDSYLPEEGETEAETEADEEWRRKWLGKETEGEEPGKSEQEKKEQWIHSFEDPQKYLKAYREFSELVFCVNAFEDSRNLEDSILYLLESEKLNRIGDSGMFRRLYAELNRALQIAIYY